jgi:hypothetical protein
VHCFSCSGKHSCGLRRENMYFKIIYTSAVPSLESSNANRDALAKLRVTRMSGCSPKSCSSSYRR